ncbi:hypothetical protein DXT99_08625 [Pontibacter diazotrophicus]|uniref:Uncharacterized protein n=1 Tax=Pontibacter diazotrophicus TaxID=1400979 RepID=A0A3D8LDX1_9BACT|nr:hypothetical protein DXT99_08625 [Pontibacter diazotrophicus]
MLFLTAIPFLSLTIIPLYPIYIPPLAPDPGETYLALIQVVNTGAEVAKSNFMQGVQQQMACCAEVFSASLAAALPEAPVGESNGKSRNYFFLSGK